MVQRGAGFCSAKSVHKSKSATATADFVEIVVPAKAGTHESTARNAETWIPACAGMTPVRASLELVGDFVEPRLGAGLVLE
jgi:hypothetical protein